MKDELLFALLLSVGTAWLWEGKSPFWPSIPGLVSSQIHEQLRPEALKVELMGGT